MTKTRSVAIDAIQLDGCQSRAGTNSETIDDYAQAWRDGAEFPPVHLFNDGGDTFYPGDGIHRVIAAQRADRASVRAIVESGGQREARLFAAAANQTNGLRRTNADKRRCVRIVLELEPKWSDRRIAEHVGVDHKLVSSVRKDQLGNSPSSAPSTRVGRDGKARTSPPAQKKPTKISGGASFDVDEIEAAPAKTHRKPKQGAPAVSAKDRKDAAKAFGVVVRFFDKMGVYEEHSDCLGLLARSLKQ